MSNEMNALAERVAALEQAVARLQAQVAPPNGSWVHNHHWAVTDEEALEEATRLGREFRKTGRIPDEPSQP
jgi:hypothetical protein